MTKQVKISGIICSLWSFLLLTSFAKTADADESLSRLPHLELNSAPKTKPSVGAATLAAETASASTAPAAGANPYQFRIEGLGVNHGGGGDVVVLPTGGDDRVVLADAWLKTDKSATEADCRERFQIPPATINELSRVARIFSSYGDQLNSDDNDFIRTRVLDPAIHYCLVDSLPQRRSCENRMPYRNLPDGATLVQAACTEDSYTWVSKSVLKDLSVREQARLYVHEGLRRMNTSEEAIAGVSEGLDVLLPLYNQQLNGHLDVLAPGQAELVKNFIRSLKLAGATLEDPRAMTTSDFDHLTDGFRIDRGGGLVLNGARVSPEAMIGVAVLVPAEVSLEKQTNVINSQLDGRISIGANTKLINSKISVCSSSLRHLKIGEGDLLQNSRLTLGCMPVARAARKDAVIDNHVRILNSDLSYHAFAHQVSIGRGSQVLDSKMTNVSMKASSLVEKCELQSSIDLNQVSTFAGYNSIELGRSVSLRSVALDQGFTSSTENGVITIGDGVRMSNIGETKFLKRTTTAGSVVTAALAYGTFGLGLIAATSAGAGEHYQLTIADGAQIDGGRHSLCAKNQFIGYFSFAEPDRVERLEDLKKKCESN